MQQYAHNTTRLQIYKKQMKQTRKKFAAGANLGCSPKLGELSPRGSGCFYTLLPRPAGGPPPLT